jgi:hypothetical protein
MPANLLYPEIGRLVLPPNVGAHTAFPLLKMDVAEFARDTPIYYRRILFLAHFNAGVRAVDVRDPYHPREVA